MERSFGVLLHPTALPNGNGIGEIGPEAVQFIEILESMGATLWQVLPLHPTAYGNSPYSADSAFAGNPLLISLNRLVEMDLLHPDDIPTQIKNAPDKVNYHLIRQQKLPLLSKAFNQFQRSSGFQTDRFKQFANNNNAWLNDYAQFRVCKEINNEKPWYQWDNALKFREQAALKAIGDKHLDTHNFHLFLQFIFAEQWFEVKALANQKNIQIIGDMPIFVAHDSADVWAHPELFSLDSNLNPVKVAGVPPDYFSETGQLWGNPLYNWRKHAETGYQWWKLRFESLLKNVDVIRVDHFRGFEKHWAIPASETTAINGQWEDGPGMALFSALSEALGPMQVIAEDLGVITPEVEKLRDDLSFPGMKILQFAFGSGPGNPYLLHNHIPESVVYTGTHDNDTTRGWWQTMSDDQRNVIARQLEQLQGHYPEKIVDDFIRICFSSSAHWAILPVQDILALDSQARFNLPGKADDNWEWQLTSLASLHPHIHRIRDLAGIFNRIKSASY